ncbi:MULTISPECIES: protein DpdG [unclassified Serratia (in: enterobacteria)]|uniref:protein DpdG n=1 Tax=unclassified Serratia (in: enterobacteria) TaxID=2647522 RepID=UPI000469013A|nr:MULTISPECIES: protein DpdG [unclassified Serratia (in: enterobacteria)]
MSIINNAHGGSQYAVLAAFYQVLKGSPRNTLPREKLMALCAPTTLQTGDSQNARGKAPQELRAWLELGILTEATVGETDEISLNTNYFSSEDIPLRQAVRRCLQAAENNRDLSLRDERAVDLTLLAALLLALDVYQNAEISSGSLEVLVSKFMTDFRINSNEVAVVPGYLSWLGYAQQITRSSYAIDPTDAIREELPFLMHPGEQLSIDEALQRLNRVLPVLDGGSYRQQVEERISLHGWQPLSANRFSTSLSRALLRLQLSGIINMKAESDASGAMQLIGRNGSVLRTVTHLTFTGTGVR